MESLNDERMQLHVYRSMKERIEDDGMFDDCGDDETKWLVNPDNMNEFYEALEIEH